MALLTPPHMTAGLLMAVAGSIAFSGKAIIVKLAYRHGVDAVTLLMFRMLFALPMFLLMAWWGGAKARSLRVTGGAFWVWVFVGITSRRFWTFGGWSTSVLR